MPRPFPPDQSLDVPVAEAPDMVMGPDPLQLLIAPPAVETGKADTVTVTLAQEELLQDVPQRA